MVRIISDMWVKALYFLHRDQPDQCLPNASTKLCSLCKGCPTFFCRFATLALESIGGGPDEKRNSLKLTLWYVVFKKLYFRFKLPSTWASFRGADGSVSRAVVWRPLFYVKNSRSLAWAGSKTDLCVLCHTPPSLSRCRRGYSLNPAHWCSHPGWLNFHSGQTEARIEGIRHKQTHGRYLCRVRFDWM
jgi:hypothetical protein